MSDRAYAKAQVQQKTLSGASPRSNLLQRTCACGQHTIAGGECSTCRSEQSSLLRYQRTLGSSSTSAVTQGNSPAQENVLPFNTAADRVSRFDHNFSKIPVYSAQSPVLQTKLKINQPGDEYEQEADRLSEQVMRMPMPQLQRACTCGGECPECQEEQPGQEHERLQTKRVQASDTGQTVAPPIFHEVLRSPGQHLDTATRAFMEERFGHDFSKIRVHADSEAAESVKTVQAQAYTVGQNVVFGAGQYAPHSQVGRRLLAHELTHTLQQGAAAPVLIQGPWAFEAENGKVPETPTPATRVLQRQPLPGAETKRCPIGQVRFAGACVPLHERPTLLGGTLQPPTIKLPSASTMGCQYSITYSNLRKLDCNTVFKNERGTDPPEPLCGQGLVYDILSVNASGNGCPATLEGLELVERVTGDKGCTPLGWVWKEGRCRIGSGGKLSGCTDKYNLCGPTHNLKGSCTEIITQELLVGGQPAETHHITFDLDKNDWSCTGTVERD